MKPVSMLDLHLEYQYMKEEIDAAIKRCLEHQKWILGPEVKELEETVAKYLGVDHCIGVSSGTEALVLSLRALAIKTKGQEYFDRSDKIITTPFTFTATGDAILRAGATPVFADIDPLTFNLDPMKVEEYLAGGASGVVGMVPVHLYGQSCDMDRLTEIAQKRGIFMVEDVAQAFGGKWREKKLGSLGAAGAFSFFPSKNLGGFGDGGMISTSDGELAGLARMLLKHGGKDKYNVEHVGYNARLDTIQAAVLLAKLKYIDEFNEKRRETASLYDHELGGQAGIIVPAKQEMAQHVYHQYTVRVAAGRRDLLQTRLKEKGIATMVYYPVVLHKMGVFNGRMVVANSLSEAEKAQQEVLSLPIEPLMEKGLVKEIAAGIKDSLSGSLSGSSPGSAA